MAIYGSIHTHIPPFTAFHTHSTTESQAFSPLFLGGYNGAEADPPVFGRVVPFVGYFVFFSVLFFMV